MLRSAVEGESENAKAEPPHESSTVEPWRDQVLEMLERGAQPKAIYDYLRISDKDFGCGLSSVKRFCKRLRKEKGISPDDVAIPVETLPLTILARLWVRFGNSADQTLGFALGRVYTLSNTPTIECPRILPRTFCICNPALRIGPKTRHIRKRKMREELTERARVDTYQSICLLESGSRCILITLRGKTLHSCRNVDSPQRVT